MKPLDRESPVPLWAQLVEDLRARTAAAEFEKRFPTDEALVQTYGVSRHTVREAVRRLRQEGLLDRQRGRGSFLSPPSKLDQPITRFYSLAQSIAAQGIEEHSRVLRLEHVHDVPPGARLSLSPSSEFVVLERLRYAGDEPLALDCSWLPAAIGDALRAEQLEHGSLYDLLAREFDVRVTGGRESIRARVPDTRTRRLLELPRGQAVLAVERVAFAGTRPVEWRVTFARGDRFSFTAEWNAPRYSLS